MKDEKLVENADRIGRELLGPGLKVLGQKHQIVGDVRGRGLFWAIELVADRKTKALPTAATMAKVKDSLIAKGLLPFMAENRIHVAPPLIVNEDEIRQALAIYDAVLGEISV
jgi:taurine--2-oxoglutarate transaminase